MEDMENHELYVNLVLNHFTENRGGNWGVLDISMLGVSGVLEKISEMFSDIESVIVRRGNSYSSLQKEVVKFESGRLRSYSATGPEPIDKDEFTQVILFDMDESKTAYVFIGKGNDYLAVVL